MKIKPILRTLGVAMAGWAVTWLYYLSTNDYVLGLIGGSIFTFGLALYVHAATDKDDW
jgi:hypothetical protein